MIILYYSLCLFSIRYRLQYLKFELKNLGNEAEKFDILSSGFYEEYKKLMENTLQIDQHFQFFRISSAMSYVFITGCGMILFEFAEYDGNLNHYTHSAIELWTIVVFIMTLFYPPTAIKNTVGFL